MNESMARELGKKPQERLGKALVKEGLLTENQLQYALQLQQDSVKPKRIGEVLIDLGYVTRRELREVSRKYHHALPLGNILSGTGLINEQQLAQALEKCQITGRFLGDVLIEDKAITEEQLAIALSEQLDYPYIVPSKRLIDRNLVRQFPQELLRQHTMLPVFKNDNVVTFVVHNPHDQGMMRALGGLLGDNFDLAIAPRGTIRTVLSELLEESSLMSQVVTSHHGEETATTNFRRYQLQTASTASGPENQIINVVDHIIAKAIQERASDIHIDTMYNKLRVRHRIDGKLVFETDLPKHIGDRLVRRIKVLAAIDMSDSTEIQDGHIYVQLDKNNVDLRVSVYPTVLGCSITIRALTREIGLKDLGDLGMLPMVLTTLRQLLDSPSGLILFAGPTGSGKTTSMYACLNYLNKDDVKICTIESPVEYSIEGVAQCQVRNPSDKQMLDKIKGMMHQDPDVIVLGEITDEVTAECAAQAALSGHKVFSTIHADDSFGAVLRLMELGLRTYLLSSTGVAAISQRLVRRICPQCKQPFTPTRETFRQFKLKDVDPDKWQFYRGKGCPRCSQIGFFGRTGVFELLAFDEDIRNAFLANSNALAVRRVAEQGERFISLRTAGFIKALQGETTLEEVLGLLSYSEQQAFGAAGLSEASIDFWMELQKDMPGS